MTAPYKLVVAGLCDEVEADAKAIGAVNNVARTPKGRLVGFNTDAPGFQAGVELAMGRPIAGAEVVVAGAGGAAHAVVYACLQAGAARVTVGNRTARAAAVMLERFSTIGDRRRAAVALDDPAFRAATMNADLAVNATTVGMLEPGVTIPVERLPAHATVFDLVYVPVETPLLRAARERGLKAANGSEMLIAQAAIAFERWTGVGGMAGRDARRGRPAPRRPHRDGLIGCACEVPEPGAIYTVGLNYDGPGAARPARAAPDLRQERERRGRRTGATIAWDRALTANVDAEVELGVVIGTLAWNVAPDEAAAHVLGYTIVNDVSSRDPWLDGDQWLLGKSMPGFCPVGPVVVTPDELDPARPPPRLHDQRRADPGRPDIVDAVPGRRDHLVPQPPPRRSAPAT